MIVQMKKVTLLVSARERDQALVSLRNLGVIHVEHVNTPSADELFSLESKLADADKALNLIGKSGLNTATVPGSNPEKTVNDVLELARKKETLIRNRAELDKHERWFSTWSDISYESLEKVNAAGLDIRFHVCSKKEFKSIPSDAPIVIANHIENKVYFAHFAEKGSKKLDFPEDIMPAVEVKEMRREIADMENSIVACETALNRMAEHEGSIRKYQEQLADDRELAMARYGMGQSESIVYLRGFCPESSIEFVKLTADNENWGYIIQEPDEPQNTPTLVRNPAWVRIIQPVFAFMGTIPGYSEFDISFWFLVFFSLFYAMLVGDAGYGLIFLVATFAAHRTFRRNFRREQRKASALSDPREPFVLMYVLSLATIVYGTLSGTWFGMTRIFEPGALPFLNTLVIQRISSINGDQDFMMLLCFFIGAVHLTIAHLLIAKRQINTLNFIAQAGWIAVIWGLFFVAETLVLGLTLRSYALPVLGTGLILIILFENYGKNRIVKGALASLANLPLSVIGAFSDVVSYLRLFAVGFATFIVASSFNQMAADVAGGIAGTAIAALIVFLGHSINIVLAVMAVVVHGIRLNMLEFSGHLNMQWSGKPYQPLASGSKHNTL